MATAIRRVRASTRSSRLVISLMVLAIVPVMLSWVRFAATPLTVAEDGADFAVFYTAGSLVNADRADLLYDVPAFQDAYVTATGKRANQTGTLFGNSPAFAVLMAPFAALPFVAAWQVFTLLGIASLVMGAWLLGPRSGRATLGVLGLLLITKPAMSAFSSGQSIFFWFLVLALILTMIERRWLRAAGVLAGLLVLKPSLLVGVGLWWIIDRRMRRALGAAIVSAAIVVAASAAVVGDAWMAYPNGVADFADLHSSSPGMAVQFSPRGFFDLVSADLGVFASAVTLALLVLGAAFLWRLKQRGAGPEVMFGAAVFASAWMSPHFLMHDWLLLAVAIAAMHRTGRFARADLIGASAVLATLAVWSPVIAKEMMSNLGWGIQVAVVGLALATWYLFRAKSIMPRTEIVIDLTDAAMAAYGDEAATSSAVPLR